jgi:hypothetical protein
MENESLDPLKREIEAIKPDAMVDITIGTGYYKRVQDAVTFVIAGKTPEDLKTAHEQIKTDTVADDWVRHYETLIILCKEFEKTAKDKGFTQKMTVEEFMNLSEKD